MRYTNKQVIHLISSVILNYLVLNPLDNSLYQAVGMNIVMTIPYAISRSRKPIEVKDLLYLLYSSLILFVLITDRSFNEYYSKVFCWIITNFSLYRLFPDKKEITNLGDDVLDGDISIINDITKRRNKWANK